jgi:uncharacterized protein with PQ loop repeat
MEKTMRCLAALVGWAAGMAALVGMALAQDTAAPVAAATAPAVEAAAAAPPDPGNTAWMLVSTVLVLLMTLPGLALFYGGLVRAKNMLSVLMQVFTIACVGMIVWVIYGYSLAFTSGGSLNSYIGGFSKAFLAGVTTSSVVETFSAGVNIPELAFVVFQMSFAAITPALIVGAFAERIRFSALILFVVLWITFVYCPIAHMVWFWGGPSLYGDPSGLIFSFGAIDFAGGTVVHINAGIAGLVGAIMVGKRTGYPREMMPPHSMTLDDGGRVAAVGRLVRLQRRLQPRGKRLRRPGDNQHIRRHGGCCPGLDGDRSHGPRQGKHARCSVRRCCRAGRSHSRRGLRRADGGHRTGRGRQPRLLLLRRGGEAAGRLRRQP